MKLRAVFFDMDGLIVDTETPDFASWRDTLAEIGVTLPFDSWIHAVGTYGKIDDILDELGVPKDGRRELRDKKRTVYLNLVQANLTPLPGFTELFKRFRKEGIVSAVVSTAGRDWVDFILGGLGVFTDFDFTLSGNDVTRGKPHPDLYELAARKANAHPQECLVFEDSANGVLAAVRAGIPVVAVPNGITRRMDFSLATVKVDSLCAVDDVLLRQAGFE